MSNYWRNSNIRVTGEDIRALSREFFWKGLVSLCNERLDSRSLFEGETDHKLPSCDAKLVRSGIFKTVGKFMAHSAMHSGIGFIGLSEAAAEYIMAENVDSDTPLPLCLADVPDSDIRGTIGLVSH